MCVYIQSILIDFKFIAHISAGICIQGVSDKCDQFRLYITGAFFTQFCQDWYQMKDE